MKKIIFLTVAVSFFILSTVHCSEQTDGIINTSDTIYAMTLNVRYDNASDGVNRWRNRKTLVASTILANKIDILGVQEALHNQMGDLQNALKDYTYIGVGRDDGKKKGEYSAIFYNKKKFKEITSGYFWLSQTPAMAGSVGWDAACTRIATWAKLQEIASGKILFVLNTHFDHIGQVARRESAKLILQQVNDYVQQEQLPAIVMGDFNATATEEPIKVLTNTADSLHLTDSRSISPTVKGPAWSFHDFGRLKLSERGLIDYIFIKNKIQIIDYEIIDGTKDNKFISDHNPVMIKVKY